MHRGIFVPVCIMQDLAPFSRSGTILRSDLRREPGERSGEPQSRVRPNVCVIEQRNRSRRCIWNEPTSVTHATGRETRDLYFRRSTVPLKPPSRASREPSTVLAAEPADRECDLGLTLASTSDAAVLSDGGLVRLGPSNFDRARLPV